MSRSNLGRTLEDGTPFGRIFAAVLLALIVYGLLEFAFVSWRQKSELQKLQQSLNEFERQMQDATVVQSPPSVASPVRRSSSYPSYPGPIEAKRRGEWKACVNRKVTLRLNGGWEQTNAPCVAYSE